MRNNPPLKKGTIHAKNARIFWDVDSGKVSVVEIGRSVSACVDKYTGSGGACYAKWQTDCNDPKTAQILCLHEFWNLVYIFGLDPEVVDSALSEIIEYQEAFRTAMAE